MVLEVCHLSLSKPVPSIPPPVYALKRAHILLFEKLSVMKFHENPCCVTRVVPCGQTDLKKLIFASRNFAKAPKNELGATCEVR